MTNLLQTVIPAAVTFLVGYQGAYPHQPAPQEHPGGHGYARALPEGHPSRATLTTPVTSAAVQPLSLRPASSWRSCSPAVVTATPPSCTPGPQPPLASPSRRDVRPADPRVPVRPFRDPQGSNRVGLIVEIPDMAAFQSFMQTDEAAEAMKHDGVRPETLLVLDEA